MNFEITHSLEIRSGSRSVSATPDFDRQKLVLAEYRRISGTFGESVLKKNDGFTLLEVLVTVAILAVLMSLLVPVVGNFRESGNIAKCSSNIREVGIALNLYANDHGGVFPPNYCSDENGARVSYAYELTKNGYVDKKSMVFSCPTARTAQPFKPVAGDDTMPRSYAYVFPAMAPNYNGNSARTRLSIRSPSKTAMLTEWHRSDLSVKRWDCSDAAWDIYDSVPNAVTHKDKKRHYLFFDGHAAFLSEAGARVNPSDPATLDLWYLNEY